MPESGLIFWNTLVVRTVKCLAVLPFSDPRWLVGRTVKSLKWIDIPEPVGVTEWVELYIYVCRRDGKQPRSWSIFPQPFVGRMVKCLVVVRSSDARWLEGRLNAWVLVDLR